MEEPSPNPADLLRYFQQLTESPAADLCRRGQAFVQAGLENAALELFEQAVAADPAYGPGWSDLGVALMRANRLKESGYALCKAIELSPNNFVSWGCLGDVYVRLNRRDEASLCLEVCQRLAPNDPRTEWLARKLETCGNGPSPS